MASRDDDELVDDAIVVPSAIIVLIGVWLVGSPFVLSYGPGAPRLNVIVCGALVAILGYLRAASATRSPQLSWANVLLGAWVFAAGFVLQSNPTPALNATVSGGMIVILGLITALTARS